MSWHEFQNKSAESLKSRCPLLYKAADGGYRKQLPSCTLIGVKDLCPTEWETEEFRILHEHLQELEKSELKLVCCASFHPLAQEADKGTTDC